MNMLENNLICRKFLVKGLEFPYSYYLNYEYDGLLYHLEHSRGNEYILTSIGYFLPKEMDFIKYLIKSEKADITSSFSISAIPNFWMDGITAKCSNEFYNPDRCRNGGGYWNYRGECSFLINDAEVTVEVNNDSCGDFGTRYSATVRVVEDSPYSFGTEEGDGVEVIKNEVYQFYWGSMRGKRLSENPQLKELSKSLGIRVIDVKTLILESFELCNMIARLKYSNKLFRDLFPKELEK